MTRIAFLDRLPWDYRVDTPLHRPLGGSQSALCYLASALVAEGYEVRLATMTRSPGRIGGVDCVNAAEGGFGLFAGAEVAVVLNDPDPEIARGLRAAIGPRGLLVLWTQHDVDQPAMASYAAPETRALFDRVVFVSDWQRQAYRRSFGPGNAISPSVGALFGEDEGAAAARPGPPTLIYASTPFRGLDVLLDAFPLIRARLPDARLVVHSSLGVYQVAEDQDGYRPLYERCRTLAGVDYRGGVAQPLLAAALAQAHCLAYPSTFPETFCTTALEAMAAGCLAVVGDLGALAETTRGLAELVPVDPDPAAYAHRFAGRVVRALADPDLAPRLVRQRRLLRETATWPVRARAWSLWLEAALGLEAAPAGQRR
jgi:glycosyltransferase involved in cell wall biosynthesis